MKNILKKVGGPNFCPIAVVIKNGRILMGHRKFDPQKWKTSFWTTPGGRCEIGETIEEALRREILEETGITDFVITDFLGEVSGSRVGDIVPIFICATEEEPRLAEPDKFSEWQWVTFDNYRNGKTGVYNPKARALVADYFSRNKND